MSTVAGSTVSGSVDGVGTMAKFNKPRGVAVDYAGNVWVADFENNLIRKISKAGILFCCW